MANTDFPHIFLDGYVETSHYVRKGGGKRPLLPSRDVALHGSFLQRKLDQAWRDAQRQRSIRERLAVSVPGREGMYLEFRGELGYKLAIKSIESPSDGIRLLSVREREEDGKQTEYATVFVPAGKEKYFKRKIDEYLHEVTPKKGLPKNQRLLDVIADIKLAVIESFWTDDPKFFPCGENTDWFEIWLRGEDEKINKRFLRVLEELHIDSSSRNLVFPERLVLLVRANSQQLGDLVQLSDDIAEIRKAKETARFLLESQNAAQTDWARALLDRLDGEPNGNQAVCILDTGVNRGHLLLEPILDPGDCQTIEPSWETHDHEGHGTLMAGLAAYGNLQQALESSDAVRLSHRLESVKILPPHGENVPDLYGAITAQAVYRAEIQAPERRRVICMAVTTTDFRDMGQPSSWSAELDALSSGVDNDQRRLFVVAAGNVQDSREWGYYPDSNLTNGVHDPGQSWNALTVGAHTWLDRITDSTCAGYKSIAPAGGLSPFSTTSLTWERKWPVKPDLVMEGGNAARDADSFCTELDDLSLISTSYRPERRLFAPFNMTSAAAAQAAWMATQIQIAYPQAWPETLRALMVHSAEWTDAMEEAFLDGDSKKGYERLLQICGYGVPDLGKALRCATSRLTLIAQQELQPYEQKSGGGYGTHDMHLFELPWPKEVLADLGEQPVTMRVTLSYFVEPGPGRIGWRDRYRYASHALRFDVNAPEESPLDFMKRINHAVQDEEEEDGRVGANSGSSHWLLGKRARDRGAIHSDIWKGNGAELAACNHIGVYPVIGWWRERAHLGRWNRKARYALVVSIHTPEQTVDIYTPVVAQIGVSHPILTEAG